MTTDRPAQESRPPPSAPLRRAGCPLQQVTTDTSRFPLVYDGVSAVVKSIDQTGTAIAHVLVRMRARTDLFTRPSELRPTRTNSFDPGLTGQVPPTGNVLVVLAIIVERA
jgi:hypothetical protein